MKMLISHMENFHTHVRVFGLTRYARNKHLYDCGFLLKTPCIFPFHTCQTRKTDSGRTKFALPQFTATTRTHDTCLFLDPRRVLTTDSGGRAAHSLINTPHTLLVRRDDPSRLGTFFLIGAVPCLGRHGAIETLACVV